VICDESKLDDQGCVGAPDLIVEILSNNTAKKDYNEKFNLYEINGVKEYWISNPVKQTVETYVLNNEVYELHLRYEKAAGIITTPLFPELSLDCAKIFV
jgi:Uma2 family endonuclease